MLYTGNTPFPLNSSDETVPLMNVTFTGVNYTSMNTTTGDDFVIVTVNAFDTVTFAEV